MLTYNILYAQKDLTKSYDNLLYNIVQEARLLRTIYISFSKKFFHLHGNDLSVVDRSIVYQNTEEPITWSWAEIKRCWKVIFTDLGP